MILQPGTVFPVVSTPPQAALPLRRTGAHCNGMCSRREHTGEGTEDRAGRKRQAGPGAGPAELSPCLRTVRDLVRLIPPPDCAPDAWASTTSSQDGQGLEGLPEEEGPILSHCGTSGDRGIGIKERGARAKSRGYHFSKSKLQLPGFKEDQQGGSRKSRVPTLPSLGWVFSH